MRSFCSCLLIIILLILSGCHSSQQIKPIKEENINFDIKTAIEMIEKKEQMIIDLASREQVSIMEYKELQKSFTEEFGNYANANDMLTMIFINNMDAEPESDIYVNKDLFYPTVFHEGITVTNAVIYKRYYENEFFNQTTLSIKEEYVGDDEKLKDWNREYIFTSNEDEEWKLQGFSGVMNFLGEDYTMNYLEFKN